MTVQKPKIVRFWCPLQQKTVKLQATFKAALKFANLKFAYPQGCMWLRQNGCTYRDEQECLLKHRQNGILGSYSCEKEA